MTDIKALLKDARLPEKTVDLCLRGDLVAEYEQVEAEHERALAERGDSLAGGNIAELRARMDDLQQQMAAANVTFRLRALNRAAYHALEAAHPPRKDDETGEVNSDDQRFGFNAETFFEPLVKGCLYEPQLDDEDWVRLLEVLTDSQFTRIALAAFLLNRGDVDVPFSLAASRPTPT